MIDTGRLDVMVNNAWVSFRSPLADGDPGAWWEMLEVNVLALAVGRGRRSAPWFGTYAKTISRSPHAAELLDAKHRLSADLVADAASRYKRLVRDVLAEAAVAGEFDLESAGLTPDTAAELLIASARGLQSSAASPAAYRRYPQVASPGHGRRAIQQAPLQRRIAAAGIRRRVVKPGVTPVRSGDRF
jgi:NAD(P)-dependent dehydrogenase (short-subunit alcohol dehydrogenase family)